MSSSDEAKSEFDMKRFPKKNTKYGVVGDRKTQFSVTAEETYRQIQDQIPGRCIEGKRLSQLLTAPPSACSSTRLKNSSSQEFFNNGLHGPLSVWMRRDRKVNNLASVMADDENDIKHLEGNVWDRKEIDPGDRVPMIS